MQDIEADDRWTPIRYRPWNAIKEEVSRCTSMHSCTGKAGFLPTRVLDISQYDRGMIKLAETDDNTVDRRYVALSYCWGKSNTFITTLSTITDRTRGFTLSDLPLTLRDAVEIAHDLGLRYIWIDALCIVQDSREDWLREAAGMASVYTNAWITIVAASARDSEEGFVALSEQLSSPLQLPVDIRPDENTSIKRNVVLETEMPLQDEPLFSRAWPLQEWELSPRRLVFRHFRVDFDCKKSPQRQLMVADGINYAAPCSLLLGTFLGQWHDSADRVWHGLVHNYSTRDLKKAEDKLPAMEGLAQRFREIAGVPCGRYLAGLWEANLPQELAWSQQPGDRKDVDVRKEETLTAPSWSWASREGGIWFDNACEPVVAEVLHAETTLASATNPFGRVLGGKVVVRGPHFKTDGTDTVVVARRPPNLGTGGPDEVRVEYLYHKEAGTIMYDDGPEGMDHVFDKQHILVISGRAWEAARTMQGVVLLETAESGVFRRIGWFTGESDFWDDCVRATRREYTII